MSIAGIAVIIIYVCALLYSIASKKMKKFKYLAFKVMIAGTMFVNVGVAIFNKSFVFLFEILYFFTIILGEYRVKKDAVVAALISIVCVLISYAHLVIGVDLPLVIPMSERMDDAYYVGMNILQEAKFSGYNCSQFLYYAIFIVSVLFSLEYIKNSRDDILNFVKKSFYVFFVIWTIEFILNNIVSAELVRDIVYSFFGGATDEKTYYPQLRNGFYGFVGLFSEQSYIGIMIVYYSISYINGIETKGEFTWFLYSMIILLINGSTTGIMLVPFAAVILVMHYWANKRITRQQTIRRLLSLIALIGIIGVVIVSQRELFLVLITATKTKITAYLVGGSGYSTSNQRSAAIRALGNQIALSAFRKCPLFGVGIGTSRGYGILVGNLLCNGIIGMIAYFHFIKKAFCLKVKNTNIILLIIVLIYSYMLLLPWYVYYACFIPLYLCFQPNLNRMIKTE